MLKNPTISTSRAGMQPLLQWRPSTASTRDSDPPVSVRLRGEQADIEAVVNHWCIQVESRVWLDVRRNQPECVVDGMLV